MRRFESAGPKPKTPEKNKHPVHESRKGETLTSLEELSPEAARIFEELQDPALPREEFFRKAIAFNESRRGTQPAEKGLYQTVSAQVSPTRSVRVDFSAEGHIDLQVADYSPIEDEKKVATSGRNKIKVTIVENAGAVASTARDMADEKLTADKAELKGIHRLPKRIWKNMWHDVYRQKAIGKAKEDIHTRGSLYEETDRADHNAMTESLIKRFASEYTETLHKDEAKDVETGPVLEDIKDLIRRYAIAGSTMSTDDFNQEKAALLASRNTLGGLKESQILTGLYHADDLLQVAQSIKENAGGNEETLRGLLGDIEVTVGKAKSGVRTEAQFTTVDRITDKVLSSKVGKFFNETTVTTGVAIAYAASVGIGQRLISSKAAAWGTFGVTAVLGAGIAGARESRRLEEERRTHFRDKAKGKTFESGGVAPRREQMEGFRYDTVSVSEKIAILSRIPGPEEEITSGDFRLAMNELAEVETRIRLSDEQKIDLLAFSDERLVEEERLQLDIARAEAKIRLKNAATANVSLLGGVANFEAFLDPLVGVKERELGADRDRKNVLFKKMKRKKIAKAMTVGLATGLVVGASAQEAIAFMNDEQQGLVEHYAGKHNGTSATALEYLRGFMGEQDPSLVSPQMVSQTLQSGPQTISVLVPQGANFTSMPTHPGSSGNPLFQFTHPSYPGKVVDSLQFTDTGELTPASKAKLNLAFPNLSIGENSLSTTTNEVFSGSAEECIKKGKSGLFTQAHRLGWYDNLTKIFDKNELRAKWGGLRGTGVDAQGNYVFDVSAMTKDGSYNKGFSVDAQQAIKDGKLKMLFSFKGSAAMVMDVSVDANGKAIIDPNSPTGKLFFTKGPKGEAVFQGGFAEVVEVVDGETKGGQNYRVLATHVGNNKGMGQTVSWEEPACVKKTVSTLSFEHFTEAKEFDFEPPPVIPILSRYPLERARRGERTPTTREDGPRPPVPVTPPEVLRLLSGPGNFLRLGYEQGKLLQSETPAKELIKSAEYATIASPALQRLLENTDASSAEPGLSVETYQLYIQTAAVEIEKNLGGEQYSLAAASALRSLPGALRALPSGRTLPEYQSHMRALAEQIKTSLESRWRGSDVADVENGGGARVESGEATKLLSWEGGALVPRRGYQLQIAESAQRFRDLLRTNFQWAERDPEVQRLLGILESNSTEAQVEQTLAQLKGLLMQQGMLEGSGARPALRGAIQLAYQPSSESRDLVVIPRQEVVPVGESYFGSKFDPDMRRQRLLGRSRGERQRALAGSKEAIQLPYAPEEEKTFDLQFESKPRRGVQESFFGRDLPGAYPKYNRLLSPKIRNNPSIELDFVSEARAYWKNQEQGYRSMVEKMVSPIEPMSESCELSVCISVPSDEDASVLQNVLQRYLKQGASKSSFEVVLLISHLNEDGQEAYTLPSKAREQINRFKEGHPDFPLRVMESTLSEEQTRSGYVRKLLNDAVLYRSATRSPSTEYSQDSAAAREDFKNPALSAYRSRRIWHAKMDHILLNNYATSENFSTGYIQGFLNDFTEHPEVDSFVDSADFDPEVFVRDPLFHVRTRLTQYMNIQLQYKEGEALASSTNSNLAFKGSIYAATGGYSPDTRVPDEDLGKKIQFARKGARGRVPVAYVASTESRRHITDVSGEDRQVDFNDPIAVEAFKEQLEEMIKSTYESLSKADELIEYPKRVQMFRRALGWLGAQGSINDEGKYLMKTDNIIELLKKYQENVIVNRAHKA